MPTDGLCLHALRVTAANSTIEDHADIADVRMWLGNASIAAARLHGRMRSGPEDSPMFDVTY